MGERPTEIDDGDATGANRQDPLTTAPPGAEQIPFELATFSRIDADHVDVMVCGMWSGDTPVLECYDSGDVVMVRVLGIDDDRREPHPYRVVIRTEVADAAVVEVRGTRHSERIATIGPRRARRGLRCRSVDGRPLVGIPPSPWLPAGAGRADPSQRPGTGSPVVDHAGGLSPVALAPPSAGQPATMKRCARSNNAIAMAWSISPVRTEARPAQARAWVPSRMIASL